MNKASTPEQGQRRQPETVDDLNTTRVEGKGRVPTRALDRTSGGRVDGMAVTVIAVTTLLGAALGCARSKRPPQAESSLAPPVRGSVPAAPRAPGPPALSLPDGPGEPPESLPRSGVLRVHLETEPPHLHVLEDAHPSASRVAMGLVFEPLLTCRAGDFEPRLAESWEIAGDRITLKLRGGVRWHDERPLTVVDVQASLEAVLRVSSKTPLLRAHLADVAAVEIIGERSVRLRLARPSQEVLGGLCNVPILPEAALRGSPGAIAAFGRQPIGTGPFRLAAWERGRRLRLAAQAGAWSGRPQIDEIVFEVDTDLTRALGRLRRGEIDLLPRVLESHYPEQVTPAALGDSTLLYRLTPERVSALVFNHKREGLADRRVRWAISLLWDRERFASEFHHGLARPAGGLFTGVSGTPFDPALAAKLLDEAGLRDGDADGVRDRAGAPIRLTYVYAAGARASAEARAYAMDLRRAGLLLDPVAVDPATLATRIDAGAFDITPMTWDGRPSDSPRLVLGHQGFLGATGYRSEPLLELLEELRTEGKSLARRALFERLDTLLLQDVPIAFLYRYDVAAVVSRRVHGLFGEGADLDLSRVWLDP